MSNRSETMVKRLVAGAALLGLASSLAFLLIACGQASTTPAQAPTTAHRTGWVALPAAPIRADADLTGVWTGRELIVSGVRAGRDGTFIESTEVAASYDPVARAWHRLPAPPRMSGPCGRRAAWTGTEMLLWSCDGKAAAFDLRASRWHRLPESPTGQGITAWTGRELIGWGGGCCGDAWSDGSAYEPATDTWRKLSRSPLAPDQHPTGAWTGRELVLVVDGINPVDGKPYPASLARAAAYDPATDTWRRLAPPPTSVRGTAVWDGRELLVAGNGRTALAYDPANDRWRRLAPLPSARFGETMVWTGKRLLLWGAQGASTSAPVPGFAYDPTDDRWSTLPTMPFPEGYSTAAAWTGHALLVWPGLGAGAALTPERSTR
jgi:hypothetical protein